MSDADKRPRRLTRVVERSIVGYNPLMMMAHVRVCDAILARRLLAAVYSYTAQRPFVIRSHHPKYREVAKIVGLDPGLILDSEDLTAGELGVVVRHLINSRRMLPSWEIPLSVAQSAADEGLDRIAESIGRAET